MKEALFMPAFMVQVSDEGEIVGIHIDWTDSYQHTLDLRTNVLDARDDIIDCPEADVAASFIDSPAFRKRLAKAVNKALKEHVA